MDPMCIGDMCMSAPSSGPSSTTAADTTTTTIVCSDKDQKDCKKCVSDLCVKCKNKDCSDVVFAGE